MAGICYLNGSMFIDLVRKAFGIHTDEVIHFSTTCITGMAFTTFLVTALCLFIPIDLAANALLFALAAGYFMLRRKKLSTRFSFFRTAVKNTPLIIKVLFCCYLLTIAVISAMPSSHFDDGLYYSGSIKWLQEYGTVPGLADLNPRFGFNSSWLILQSLFGFHFLSNKLFNDLNGLLYVLVLIYSLQGVTRLLKGDRTFITFLKSFFFIPVLVLHFTATHDFILYNINFFSSPSPDVPASLIMWMVFMLFLDQTPAPEAYKLKQVLIAVLVCFLLTIKLSVIPIALFILYFLVSLLKHKQVKQFFLVVAGCMVYLLPWLSRNVMISGYIVFPFSKLDLFSFDWKVPLEHVQYHENVVRIWAINPQYELGKELQIPFTEWFPDWFDRLTYIQSLVIVFIIGFSIIWAIVFLYGLFRKGLGFIKTHFHTIFFIITSLAGILFWFYKGPDLRLGFGFCLFFCMYGISAFVKYFTDDFPRQVAMAFIAFALGIFAIGYQDIWTNSPLQKIASPLTDYPMPNKTDSVTLAPGIVLHLAADGDPCKNCAIPCTWQLEYGVFRTTLRGTTLKEGFKPGK